MEKKRPRIADENSTSKKKLQPKTVVKGAGKKHSQPQSAKTGKFVTKEYAKRHPNTTNTENYISKPKITDSKPPKEKK